MPTGSAGGWDGLAPEDVLTELLSLEERSCEHDGPGTLQFCVACAVQ